MVASVTMALAACSSKSGAPPTIAGFTLTSPVTTTTTVISGSVVATDTTGLSGLSITLDVTGPISATLTAPVSGGSTSETSGTVPIVIELSQGLPAGSYQVALTLTADGEASNSLDATLVVQ